MELTDKITNKYTRNEGKNIYYYHQANQQTETTYYEMEWSAIKVIKNKHKRTTKNSLKSHLKLT